MTTAAEQGARSNREKLYDRYKQQSAHLPMCCIWGAVKT
jgi:hypothetical protein